MWFADIICDLDWFMACQGCLGAPRSRVRSRLTTPDIEVEFLIYGGEFAVRHLRVLLHTDDHAVADACVDSHISFWVHSLEVSSALATGRVCTAATFPSTSLYAVVLGEGGETEPSLQLFLEGATPTPPDYEVIADGLVNWSLEARHHLFYLRRFVDESLPPDVRWLAGYRLMEWHFLRGKTKPGLDANTNWRELLEDYRSQLEAHLSSGQSLYGLFEQARALAAHAILDKRTAEERTKKPGDAVTWTFATLEAIVIRIMNDSAHRRGRIELCPRQAIPTTSEKTSEKGPA